MKINIKLNIEKKYALIIIGLLVVIAGIILGYAYNSNPANPSVMGHSVDELNWSKLINNTVRTVNVTASNVVWSDAGFYTGGPISAVGDICAGAGTRWQKCISSIQSAKSYSLQRVTCLTSETGNYEATVSCTANCPAGTVVVGGGCTAPIAMGQPAGFVVSSYPASNTSWYCAVNFRSWSKGEGFAICMNV